MATISPTPPGPTESPKRNRTARSRIQVRASPTPASARDRRRAATAPRRVGTTGTRRVRHVSTETIAPRVAGATDPIALRARISAAARSGLTRRAQAVAINVPTLLAETRRAGIVAMRAPPHVLPTGNSATRSPTPRATAAARSGLTRRVAKGSAKTATVPTGNSAATRSFRAARRIAAVPARASATGRIVARISARTAANPNLGRSAMRVRPTTPAAIRARPATAREISKNRVLTNRVTNVAAMTGRGFRVHARIVPRETVRVSIARAKRAAIARNSIAPAKTATPGRSIRVRRPVTIARAATTRTTARFSPSARRSAAVAPTANANRTSGARHVPRGRKSPASVLPR